MGDKAQNFLGPEKKDIRARKSTRALSLSVPLSREMKKGQAILPQRSLQEKRPAGMESSRVAVLVTGNSKPDSQPTGSDVTAQSPLPTVLKGQRGRSDVMSKPTQ